MEPQNLSDVFGGARRHKAMSYHSTSNVYMDGQVGQVTSGNIVGRKRAKETKETNLESVSYRF
jgi:hypothetical protein